MGAAEGEPMASTRSAGLIRAAGLGVLCGIAGVAAMTAGENIEQAVTSRPNSSTPARTLLALLGRRPGDGPQPAG